MVWDLKYYPVPNLAVNRDTLHLDQVLSLRFSGKLELNQLNIPKRWKVFLEV